MEYHLDPMLFPSVTLGLNSHQQLSGPIIKNLLGYSSK
jgi:hypothetical protein